MRQGKLFYDKEIGRYNFIYESDGEKCDYRGIHCGEVLEFKLNDVWVEARVEYSDTWYLVGLNGLKMDGLEVRTR